MPKYPRLAVVDDDEPHRSAETRMTFPQDIRLRDHGFKIAHRPDRYTAIWKRDGTEYVFAIAIRICDREDAAGGRLV